MQKKTFNRLLIVTITSLTIITGIIIVLYNLKSNIVFFYPLSEISNIKIANKPIRIGGLVKENSIMKFQDSGIKFTITDGTIELSVYFKGIIPILFREHQWVIIKGNWKDEIFYAKELLTKHDETYRPK